MNGQTLRTKIYSYTKNEMDGVTNLHQRESVCYENCTTTNLSVGEHTTTTFFKNSFPSVN